MIINNPFEKNLKKIVLDHLYKKGKINRNTTVINELTIDSFSRRVDLAIVDKDKLIAYEIKSEADSLYRLSGQLDKYLEYFDKIIVVTTPKHLESVLKISNENIEVWEVDNDKIIIKKKSKANKNITSEKYLDLLKVDEMKKLSRKFNLSIGSKVKSEIKIEIALKLKKISLKEIKIFVADSISRRYYFSSKLFLENVMSKNKVGLSDIDFLSPYFLERKANTVNCKKNILEQLAEL